MLMLLSPFVPFPKSILYICVSILSLRIDSPITFFLDSIYMCYSLYLFFSFWLTFCITGSRFIHLTRTVSQSFLIWLSNIPLIFHCRYEPHLQYFTLCIYHSSVDGRVGCFRVLAIVSSAAVNIGVHVSFSVMVFLGYMPSSGVIGSFGNFIPSFLRNLHIVLHSGCTSLHFH